MFDIIVGVGVELEVLWDCWGEWGWRVSGLIQLNVKRGLHVKDRTNDVKCLGIWHNVTIWKNYAMSLFTFLDPPPSWKIFLMSLFPLYYSYGNMLIYAGKLQKRLNSTKSYEMLYHTWSYTYILPATQPRPVTYFHVLDPTVSFRTSYK